MLNTLTASLQLATLPVPHPLLVVIASVTSEPARREYVCQSDHVSTSSWCDETRVTYVVHNVDIENLYHFVHRAPYMVHDPLCTSGGT